MTLPQVYELFGYWRRLPPLTELVRMLALSQGIKQALPPQAQPMPQAAPRMVTAAPDPSAPLPAPLPEHDAAVRAVAQALGGQVPTAKRKVEISLEDFVANLLKPKPG